MYCQYYGLSDRPFNVTADPAFFYASRKHDEALSHLLYGITQRKGIMCLTGEVGTGKTTVCRYLLAQLSRLGKEVKTALILNTHYSDVELLEAIVRDFGINAPQSAMLPLLSSLNAFLLRESAAGNNVVLIIDEAQGLSREQLEQVRLLSNLETEKDKLLQIILVGQPELNAVLENYSLRQLNQRIVVRYHISPLNKDEIREYIAHRLRVANSQRLTFSDDALEAVAEFSLGTPRLVNILCDRALLAGFVAQTDRIDSPIIERSLAELQSIYPKEHHEHNLRCVKEA